MIQLVGESGETIGQSEKIAAHEHGGTWHRAISVFLFDEYGRLLLQKRASSKYHFAGLWANSCCSHPTTTETVLEAAKRAMKHEIGVEVDVHELAVVRYESLDPVSGHTEKEHDHILLGKLSFDPEINSQEVEEVRWILLEDLKAEIAKQPESFAPWLPIILNQVAFFD